MKKWILYDNKNIIVEAAISINRGVSPMVLEESLKIFLSPKLREKPAADDAGEEAAGAEASAQAESKAAPDEDVVDADFEEVKDNK